VASFILATTNVHKVEEIRAILAPFDVTLVPRPTDVPDVVEDGDTLEDNALLKARALVAATGVGAIADDTGLFVDALGGRPGVRSARFAGENATNEQNVAKLLAQMQHVALENRAAHFRTVAAVAYPDGDSATALGQLDGWIALAREGSHGFGYDPIFCVEERGGVSLASLTSRQKHEVSHRGRAFRALTAVLHDY